MKKTFIFILTLLFVTFSMTACKPQDDSKKESNSAIVEEDKKDNTENKEENKEGNKEVEEEISTEKNAEDYSAMSEEEIYKSIIKSADDVIDNGDSVTFKDDSGREEITISKHPQSVTVLFSSYAALYAEMGGKINGIIGGKLAKGVYEFQLGRDLTEEGTVVVESTSAKKWDLEKILDTKPDLIITAISSNGYQTAKKLGDEIGVPVIGMNYSGISEYVKWAKVFSLMNDRDDLFQDIALNAARESAKIIANVPKDKSINAISLFPTSKGIRVNRNTSDLGKMLMDLGVQNSMDDGVEKDKGTRYEVGVEDIYSANPEIIFVQCPKSEEFSRGVIEKYGENDPLWAEIDAVKNEKVFFLPRGLFHNRPNSKYGESYQILFEHLYGDK